MSVLEHLVVRFRIEAINLTGRKPSAYSGGQGFPWQKRGLKGLHNKNQLNNEL